MLVTLSHCYCVAFLSLVDLRIQSILFNGVQPRRNDSKQCMALQEFESNRIGGSVHSGEDNMYGWTHSRGGHFRR